jgi:hypothetical protein
MMPIHLNFLRDDGRRAVKSAAILAWLGNIMRCLFIVFIVFDGFLCLIFFLFHDQVQVINRISSDSGQRYAYYNEEIQKINDQTGQLSLAGKNFGLLTARFWSIVNSVPQNIKISNIVLDINDTTINIPGIATTRETLIAYDASLASLPWVEKTYLPKSQLLKKEDVPFLIQLTIKPETK